MDLRNFLVLLAFIINLFLSLLIYFRAKKTPANVSLIVLAFAVTAWCMAMFFYRGSTTVSGSIFWAKLLYFFPAFAPTSYLLCGLYFPTDKVNTKIVNLLIVVTFIMTSLTLIHGAVIKDVQFVPGEEKKIIFGWAYYYMYTIYMPLIFIISYVVYFKKYRRASAYAKMQILYLLVGMSATSIPAMVTNLNLPTFGYFGLNWLGQLFTVFWVGSIAYAIIKHRFLDLRLVVARAVAYLLLTTILGFIYSLGVFVFANLLFRTTASKDYLYLSTVLALFIAFSVQPLKNYLENVTDNIFFKGKYNSNELVLRFTQIMASTLVLADMTKNTLNQLLETMHITRGAFILFSDDKKIYVADPTQANNIHINQELVKKLFNLKRIVIFDEEEDEAIKQMMRELNVLVSVPLYEDGHNEGLLVLGEKKSGEFYSQQDIEVLEILGPEVSVALHNTKSYEEISKFNITLKKEVAKATKQLKELTEQQKDQVDIMGHEVKTPLTVISQQLNLLLELILTEDKRKGLLNGKIKPEDAKWILDGLKKMQVAELQEESIVTNMIEAARLEKLRFELNYSTFDVVELVKLAIKDSETRLEANHQKGSIALQTELKNLQIEADSTRIKQCIDGLLTNAEKYGRNPHTLALDITVSIKVDHSMISISVKDHGMGIAPNDLEKLGKKFSRLNSHIDGSKLARPGGSGLGLYTYKGIIERHHGQLIITSEGLGKGSTFTLEFPIKKLQ